MRLPEAELDAIRLLTHDEGMAYQDYIDLIVAADGEAGTLARAIEENGSRCHVRRCAFARDGAVERPGRALAALWRRT